MVTFNFATAQRICFGAGRFAELGGLAAGLGRRVCLVTGEHSLERSGRLAALGQMFEVAGLEWLRVRIGNEPTTERVNEGTLLAREFGAEVVVAIGGGSVLDGGKAIAALLGNGGEVLDYLEGVGRGKALAQPSRPFIAVPTTAGTGSEATKNAVIGDEAKTYKKSMRADGMLPTIALVDPELTYDCPADVSAASGMDAMSQLLEAFTSRQANPLIDTLAGLGLGMVSHLPQVIADPHDRAAREAMSMASLLGGIALANAGLGAIHGLASPLGAYFPIPHGVVCADLLAPVVRMNAGKAHLAGNRMLLEKYCAAAIQIVQTQSQANDEAEEITERARERAGGIDEALGVAIALSRYLEGLREQLGILGLRHYKITRKDFPKIIAGASGGSMKTNPVALNSEDLERILEEAL